MFITTYKLFHGKYTGTPIFTPLQNKTCIKSIIHSYNKPTFSWEVHRCTNMYTPTEHALNRSCRPTCRPIFHEKYNGALTKRGTDQIYIMGIKLVHQYVHTYSNCINITWKLRWIWTLNFRKPCDRLGRSTILSLCALPFWAYESLNLVHKIKKDWCQRCIRVYRVVPLTINRVTMYALTINIFTTITSIVSCSYIYLVQLLLSGSLF